MPPVLYEISDSSSSGDEGPDIMEVISGNKQNSHTYQSQLKRRSSRLDTQRKQDEYQKRRAVASSEFVVQIPSIFKTKGAKLHDTIKRNKNFIEIREQDKQELKIEYEKIQQHKSKIIMELNDNGSNGLQKYDAHGDSELIESLMMKQEVDSMGIQRHFYFLRDVDDIMQIDGVYEKLPQSLLFLIKRDPKGAFGLVKDDLKNFIMRSLQTVLNPMHLQAINDMIVLHLNETKDIFTTNEFIDLVDKCGGNTNLINVKSLPIKILQFNSNLRIQLVRLSLLFNCYLMGSSVDWNMFVRLFIMIICDHNCNNREDQSLVYFIESVSKVIASKSDPTDYSHVFERQVRSLSTCVYGNNEEEKELGAETKPMSKGDYQLILTLLYRMGLPESIKKELHQVELDDNAKNIFEFLLKLKTDKDMVKQVNVVLALKSKLHTCIKNASDFQTVELFTEAYQRLDYLANIALQESDFMEGDIFYNNK